MYILFAMLLLLVGFIIGITGIGGFLFTPLIMSVFGMDIREAIIISLGSFIIITGGSSLVYLKNRKINGYHLLTIVAGAYPGIIAGLVVNLYISGFALKLCFTVFLLGASILLLNGNEKQALPMERLTWWARSRSALLLAGFAGGFMAGFIGVGGPIVTIPFMIYAGYEPKTAIGTSMAGAVFITLLAFTVHRFYTPVSLVHVLCIGFLGMLSSLVGSRLSEQISQEASRRLVSLVTFFSSLYLLYHAFNG
jgi:uncharacterized protein